VNATDICGQIRVVDALEEQTRTSRWFTVSERRERLQYLASMREWIRTGAGMMKYEGTWDDLVSSIESGWGVNFNRELNRELYMTGVTPELVVEDEVHHHEHP